MNPRDWMKEGGNLPHFLKDFHDAKDFFKALEQTFKETPELAAHTWISNQIFTIDHFLWFCGIHGYTLQKSRKKGVEFEDIDTRIAAENARRQDAFARMLAAPSSPGAETP